MIVPHEVYVRAYKAQGFVGKAIKWFTFGDYSHVSLVFDFEGRGQIEYESIQGAGVICHAPTELKEYDLFRVPLNHAQVQLAWHWAKSIRGKYDWGGIWGFMRRKERQSDRKWFCSEYVAYVLLKAGYPLSRRDPYRETPTTVAETLRLEAVFEGGGA